MFERTKKVPISTDLYRTIAANLGELGVDSVREYVEDLVMRDLREKGLLPAYTEEEEREVERRLRDLGYLD
ncbi:MAG: CopG family transcriptional regulator [Caldiserica bacterium]|nr:CopG family transcriptional regulator [Caldisericota bacterium]